MKSRIYRIIKKEAGFTLIEVIVSLAITSFIGMGATIASFQVLEQTTKNNDYTTASRNAMNAMYWISRDVQMAQTMDGASGFPVSENLTFEWTEWDGTEHQVTYSVNDNELKRSHSLDGDPAIETLIAEYINTEPGMTGASSDNGTLTVTITSSIGEGDREIDVTRVHEIASRPEL